MTTAHGGEPDDHSPGPAPVPASAMSVRTARRDELDAVTAVLGLAFAEDPVVRWLITGRVGRAKRREKLFALELESHIFEKGQVWVSADGGAITGACLVLPPGEWELPQATSLSEARHWLRVFQMQLPAAARTEAFMSEHHPVEPHWYIRYVGVLPSLQGHGLGTALMGPVLERCDAEWLPAYLEASTEHSASLYERLGFVHLGALKLPGGPTVWPMRRAPTTRDGSAV